jgi:aspartyl/glutamyl-tRNA(Asn/Gln) amidotransferase C subunit
MGLADAPLDRSQLDCLCRLARLDLAGGDRERLAHRLRAVVQAFATLAAVDTTGVPPHGASTHGGAGGRDDEPGPVLPPETVLANSRATAAGCFLVPRVVEG